LVTGGDHAISIVKYAMPEKGEKNKLDEKGVKKIG